MADEKKKPDLKARLNRTAAAQGAPPPASTATPSPADPVAPSTDFVPTPAPIVAPDDDLVVPDFIKQQMAEKAAAEARAAEEARLAVEAEERRIAEAEARKRRAALAADPFGSSAAVAQPQDIRLVLDDKHVEDHEVGRKNTGSIVAVFVAAAVALGVGFLGGNWLSDREQANRTRAAVVEIRQQVDAAGAIISTMKEKVDRAAEAAAIPAARGNEEPPAPTTAPAAARVEEDLHTWFAQQQPDPPLTPESYAGRVGRLRPELLQKLMKVQIQLQEAWMALRHHQEITAATLPVIRGSLEQLQPTRTNMSQLMVVFEPGQANGPPVMGSLVFARPPGETGTAGQFTIEPAITGTPPTRGLYTSGDLTAPAVIRTVGIPVRSQGLPATFASGLARPWLDYQARLRSLRGLVDQLANDHRQLADALNH